MKIIKERSSNIEMLRIIAMLLIVMHHYSLHSNFQFDPTSIQLNHVFVQSLQVGGKIGVAIFVIVMGYFSVYSGYKKTKAIKLWAEICFYSVSGMFIVSLLNKTLNSLTVERIIYAFFPITSFLSKPITVVTSGNSGILLLLRVVPGVAIAKTDF